MGRLFWKIFLGFWLTLVAVAAGVGFAVHWYSQEQYARLSAIAAGPRAEFGINAVAATLRHAGPAEARALIEEWHRDHPMPVLVVNNAGQELLGRPVPPGALAQARAQLKDADAGNGVRRVTATDGHTYFLFVPVGPATREPHPPHVEPPLPPRILPQLISALIASLIFSAGLAWYLTRPVRHLRVATRRLADGALDERVMPRIGARRDEIADLGRDFDHMAERLQTLIAAQKRLLHDVSHELRSPLARLHALASTLERIERETKRLDDLVGEVLTLSRLEAGVSGAAEEYFDLTGLLEAVVGDATFEAGTRGCHVALAGDGETLIRGRAELLRRAFDNVVRNALTYTGADSSVEVNARKDTAAGRVVVSVCDRGPGVADTELGTIFEPFFRGKNDGGRGGYGLGLAIAKRAVIAHGGSIRALNRDGGGLCIEITLPLVASGPDAD
jgi:two-component system OmpR family sensor kinase